MIHVIQPRYLGDGVYAQCDGEYIWLLVGSHDNPTDKVALDRDTYAALLAFAKSAWKQEDPR